METARWLNKNKNGGRTCLLFVMTQEEREGNHRAMPHKIGSTVYNPCSFTGQKEIPMNRLAIVIALLVLSLAVIPQVTAQLRPPSTPLIVHDPYFSVWSATDNLTDSDTTHWTGASQPISGLVRVDGNTYRFMGKEPSRLPAMQQVSKLVTPTRTTYDFEKDSIHLTLTFFTPALAADLTILSRPVTYISWEVKSLDSATHAVSVYLDCSSLLAVNTPYESVVWSRAKVGGTELLSVGSSEQHVLGTSGDDLRIDWGHFYLAAPDPSVEQVAAVNGREARQKFSTGGGLPDADLLDMPATPRNGAAVLASTVDFGNVGANPVSRHILVAYDDQFSIEYLNRKLRPYWRKDGANFADLLRKAVGEYESLLQRSIAFDQELTTDLTAAGGREYETAGGPDETDSGLRLTAALAMAFCPA
jgi:hypothetical protein